MTRGQSRSAQGRTAEASGVYKREILGIDVQPIKDVSRVKTAKLKSGCAFFVLIVHPYFWKKFQAILGILYENCNGRLTGAL